MGVLTIHDFDETVASRLRARAEARGHSIEEEAMAILTGALAEITPGQRLLQTIREEFGPLGGVELDLPPRVPDREPPRFEDW